MYSTDNPTGKRKGADVSESGIGNGTVEVMRAPQHGHGDNTQAPTPLLENMGQVQPKPIEWMWPGRIPLGKVTVYDGDPGTGKSQGTISIAACVSSGGRMPDGTKSDLRGPRGVVMLSAEDDPADTIRPRLDAAGADVNKVSLLTGIRTTVEIKGELKTSIRLPSLADIDPIRAAIERCDAALVVIDPIMAYLGGDAHKDQDVRQALAPLAKLAADTGVAVLIVRHLNKAGGSNAIYRGGGSIGIIGAARSGLLAAKDPDDPTGERFILAVTKSNLAAPAPSLTYRIEPVEHVSRVVWEGTSEHTATSLLATPTDEGEKSALDEAVEWLEDALQDGGIPSKEIQDRAKRDGVSLRTLERAKKRLGVKAKKRGFEPNAPWVWILDRQGPRLPELATLADYAGSAKNGAEYGDNSKSGLSGPRHLENAELLTVGRVSTEDFQGSQGRRVKETGGLI